MTQWVAVGAAVGAATSVAVAAALQHRTASAARRPRARPTEGLARFAGDQVTRPLWWISLGVQLIGLLLHATALHAGSLALVQPLLTCGVVLALVINHGLARTPITARELAWAVVVVAGLSGFLLFSGAAADTHTTARGGGVAGPLATAVGVIAVGCALLLARRSTPVPAAALLGAAAGIAFTAQAAFLQSVTDLALHDPAALPVSAVSYGLVVAGVGGVALTQLAYRAGPLAAALPAITTVNPLLSVLVGVLVAHEYLRATTTAIAGAAVSLALLCLGAVALSRPASAGADDDAGGRDPMCHRRRS